MPKSTRCSHKTDKDPTQKCSASFSNRKWHTMLVILTMPISSLPNLLTSSHSPHIMPTWLSLPSQLSSPTQILCCIVLGSCIHSRSQRISTCPVCSVGVHPEEGVEKQEHCNLVLDLNRLKLCALLSQLLLHGGRPALGGSQLVLQATACRSNIAHEILRNPNKVNVPIVNC
jgi:hypothetical protein